MQGRGSQQIRRLVMFAGADQGNQGEQQQGEHEDLGRASQALTW